MRPYGRRSSRRALTQSCGAYENYFGNLSPFSPFGYSPIGEKSPFFEAIEKEAKKPKCDPPWLRRPRQRLQTRHTRDDRLRSGTRGGRLRLGTLRRGPRPGGRSPRTTGLRLSSRCRPPRPLDDRNPWGNPSRTRKRSSRTQRSVLSYAKWSAVGGHDFTTD